MKKCAHCNKFFDDKFDFCTSCGEKLEQQTQAKAISAVQGIPKRWLFVGLSGLAVVLLVVGYIVNENKKFSDAQQAIQDHKIQQYIDEQVSKVNTWDLHIESGWTWEKDGNYIYIRGSVKNVSDKTISYFKLSADFLDSKGNIIDSDWTNDGDGLKPNASQKFEFMHKYDSAVKDIKLEISEVN